MKTFVVYLVIGCAAIATTYYFITRAESQKPVLSNKGVIATTSPGTSASGAPEAEHLRNAYGDTTTNGRSSAISGDANHNGVRDDIDEVINNKYPDGEQRRAFFQYAHAEQKFLSAGGSPAGARQGIQEIDKAIQCLRAKAPEQYQIQSKQLLALLLNTPENFSAYALATKNLGGQVIPGYSGSSPCE
ncbi:hypothetical protein [Burkholderia sp. SRS-W-2-2016]|uniref:hypothetical protein n=1 Tax=Burkholderia sp. SRS-W-2-2016 TaxID=1926878 RepID=UPI00118168B1|nr:hypothetical protein [Burkholderia sp. SRS-W-2-2016]